MKRLKYLLFINLAMICFNYAFGQTVVQDKANNGQFKRMVGTQWDDWQPTPETNWLGLPKNPVGWFYWRILHHDYWDGEDRRPWRVDGPFSENYLSLVAQEELDQQIEDTTKAMMEITLATDLSMSGGIADLPYQLYFKTKFDGLFEEVSNYLNSLSYCYPAAFNEMMGSPNGKKYMEYLEITRERIETINQLYVDRGARMVSYFKILDDLQPMCVRIKAYVKSYAALAKIPSPEKINMNERRPLDLEKTDEEIVRELLKNWQPN